MPETGIVGVVTVTYNSAPVIHGFMHSLLSQSFRNFRLYVIDNSSSDETLAALSHYPDPRVVVMRAADNVGVAEANNIGIRAALSDGCTSVLLINNDTAFDANLISTLKDGLHAYQCDMIVPKILYFDAADKVWSAGGEFSRLRGRSRHLGFNEKDDGRSNRPRQVDYAPTCCMLIRRDVFERVGLMDANYFVYFDDADFCFRAQRAGVRLVYLPHARLLHKVSSLIGHRSDTSVRYVSRNHVYFVLKHFGILWGLYYLPICQVHIAVRCLLAQHKLRAFAIAQKAFWEGISLYVSTHRLAGFGSVAHIPGEIAPQRRQREADAAGSVLPS